MSTNGTQSEFIKLIYAAPIVISDVLISTTFITVGEILYKVILSEL